MKKCLLIGVLMISAIITKAQEVVVHKTTTHKKAVPAHSTHTTVNVHVNQKVHHRRKRPVVVHKHTVTVHKEQTNN
ncbi:MAG: hypothetical protein JWN76_3494 [Chitinophagaceae bacterium]|nr:hypothetical protein [Chitinophagaceae bacterium]